MERKKSHSRGNRWQAQQSQPQVKYILKKKEGKKGGKKSDVTLPFPSGSFVVQRALISSVVQPMFLSFSLPSGASAPRLSFLRHCSGLWFRAPHYSLLSIIACYHLHLISSNLSSEILVVCYLEDLWISPKLFWQLEVNLDLPISNFSAFYFIEDFCETRNIEQICDSSSRVWKFVACCYVIWCERLNPDSW